MNKIVFIARFNYKKNTSSLPVTSFRHLKIRLERSRILVLDCCRMIDFPMRFFACSFNRQSGRIIVAGATLSYSCIDVLRMCLQS